MEFISEKFGILHDKPYFSNAEETVRLLLKKYRALYLNTSIQIQTGGGGSTTAKLDVWITGTVISIAHFEIGAPKVLLWVESENEGSQKYIFDFFKQELTEAFAVK